MTRVDPERRLRRLQSIALDVAPAVSTVEVLDLWMESFAVFEASAGAWFSNRDGTPVLERVVGVPADPFADSTHPGSSVAAVLNTGEPCWSPSTDGDQTWLCVPLRGTDQLLGALALRYPADGSRGPRDVDFVGMLALHFGMAMARTRLLEQLQEAHRFEQRMIATLGHDLRSPVSAIALYTRLIRSSDVGSLGEMADRIDQSVARVIQVLDDVLGLARNREHEPPLEHLDLVPTVQRVAMELRDTFPGRVVELITPPTATLETASGLVAQILINLGRNALIHGAEAPIRMTLTVDEAVRLTVFNQGTPIPPAFRASLFAAFEQAGTSGEGFGLGLYIVDVLAKKLGGVVDFDSTDEGTWFRLSLPKEAAFSSTRRPPRSGSR